MAGRFFVPELLRFARGFGPAIAPLADEVGPEAFAAPALGLVFLAGVRFFRGPADGVVMTLCLLPLPTCDPNGVRRRIPGCGSTDGNQRVQG